MRFKVSLLLLIFFLLITSIPVSAQSKIEKLELKLKEAQTDSSRAEALNNLSWEYINTNPNKGIPFIEEAIEICKRHN